MTYGELQRALGKLLHDEDWVTRSIPKAAAKAGAWVENKVFGEHTFIRPWMVDTADEHYALDLTRARDCLGWDHLGSTTRRSIRESARSTSFPPGSSAHRHPC